MNYSGIEQDDDIASSIDGYISSDFLQAFYNLEACKEYVGGDHILSKIGCIIRWNWDHALVQWTMSKRLIMDSKQIGVKRITRKQLKTVLARVIDAIHSCLDFMRTHKLSKDIKLEQFIIDIAEAFWSVPTSINERK